MSTIRFKALQETFNRKPVVVEEAGRRSELFGQNVFNEASMRQFMTKDAFKSVMDAIQYGTKIDRKMADQVAAAMKDWAISKGATHYSHWFQPLTGSTAEKHDAFFETIGGGLEEDSWFNKNLMLQVFQMVVYAIPLKREDIRLGILPLQRLFMELLCVFLLYLFLIQEKHLITKLLY